jgi:hypothetical protein
MARGPKSDQFARARLTVLEVAQRTFRSRSVGLLRPNGTERASDAVWRMLPPHYSNVARTTLCNTSGGSPGVLQAGRLRPGPTSRLRRAYHCPGARDSCLTSLGVPSKLQPNQAGPLRRDKDADWRRDSSEASRGCLWGSSHRFAPWVKPRTRRRTRGDLVRKPGNARPWDDVSSTA